MHHEVVVPIPVRLIWDALRDPDRLAECVPGLLPDTRPGRGAGGGPEVVGRLRLRVGTTSVTYRGVLTVTEADDLPLAFVASASGTESRGGAAVRGELQVRLDDEGADTRIVFDGAVTAAGRTAELDPAQLHAAAVRLADRFTAALTEELAPLRDQENPAALLGRGYTAEEADDVLLGVGSAPTPATGAPAGHGLYGGSDAAAALDADADEEEYDPDAYDVREGASTTAARHPYAAAAARGGRRRRPLAVLSAALLVLVWWRLRRRPRAGGGYAPVS